MNINRLGRAMEIYTGNGYKKPLQKSGESKKRDELEISTSAKFHQIAMVELKNIPDIREDKVAAIKERVDSGTYEVDAKMIVSKMMHDAKGIY